MVRFCRDCRRAIDDLDKFCRNCGNSTNDSIDYHTYYRLFLVDKTISSELFLEELENVVRVKTEDKPETNVEIKPEAKDEVKPEAKEPVDIGEIQEVEIKTEKKDIASQPQEVIDKLDLLLPNDGDNEQKAVIQYLKDKYNPDKNKNPTEIVPSKPASGDTDITLYSSEEVIKTRCKKEGKRYRHYESAIYNYIPQILKDIERSKDGIVKLKLSDVTEKMGEEFTKKAPVSIFQGLKYVLFRHNIWVETESIKEGNIKVLIMRMKLPDDKLPPSMTKRS